MTHDKQLQTVTLDTVVEKRRLAQALNAKEFAVLVGVSYSAAREWFRLPGFPVFRGVVFWQDFERWRDAQTGLSNCGVPRSAGEGQCRRDKATMDLPPQACRIVDEFG
jgi:hypothetical protein